MRILFWTGLFPPFIGGLEQFGLQLCGELRKRGHEVAVVSSQTGATLPDFTEVDGIPVHRFEFSRTMSTKSPAKIAALSKQVIRFKHEFQPDVVHLNDFNVGLFYYERTLDTVRCPTVYTMHATPMDNLTGNSLVRRILLASAWVPAVSQAMLDSVLSRLPEITNRSSVLLNGYRSPDLVPTLLTDNDNARHIVCIGRVITDKGFDFAINAVAELLPDFPDLRLTIAGDGEVLPHLEAQAARLGIAHAVHLPGWIAPDDIPALINTAAMVVVPSRWVEPFGLVAVQAAQMARPVVAANIGGLPEIVIHEKTGLLAAPHDSHSLAENIRRLLNDPAYAQQLGKAARQRADECFTLDRMVDDYERLFERIVREQSS